MITKINNIKDFGVFKNFNGNTLPEFKTFNLIYGWNYSGKTTLSRVFRCLEMGKLHDDYLTSTFEFENQTTKYDNTFSVKPNIRVFNSDFIKENLKWDAENIEPIFLLGAENIELQKELDKKEKSLLKAEEDLVEAENLKEDTQTRINSALTNKAREITNILSLGRSFDRDKLKQIVELVKDDVSNYILDTDDFNKYKTQAISTDQKPIIGEIELMVSDVNTSKTEVESLLSRQAASENKIQKLLDSKPLSDWVESGKNLHESKTECEFCGNSLPSDLLKKLNEHFSKDYDLMKLDIKEKLDNLNKAKIVLTNQIPSETAFYTDIQADYRSNKSLLLIEIANFNNVIDFLIKDLKSKIDKPFDKLELTPFVDNKENLETAIANFNLVIVRNDKRTADFAEEKILAIEKLKKHFAAEFETNETYSTIQTNLINQQTAIDTKSVDIENQKQAIIFIKAQLDETVKGAGLVNDYLQMFFGKNDIKIEPTTDKKFRLVRGTEIAKNLSEGEKTAISFAYYTTKLEEQNNQIADTIIFIDDPVSSLDSNHLFNIYSFIRNIFYEATKDTNGGKLHICKCKQLFISTHNFDFYNLVYDWFSKTKNTQTPQAYFLVERIKNPHKDESSIVESDSLIQRYKSEYVYLFSLIYKFYQNPTDTFENLYHLPNILRKFVETYLNFKFLSAFNIEESISELITNPIECERARKFMHYYSHSLTTDKFMKFADLSECIDVVNIIINSIKNNDSTHFKSLTESVSV